MTSFIAYEQPLVFIADASNSTPQQTFASAGDRGEEEVQQQAPRPRFRKNSCSFASL